jgi:hypothetical protein
VPPHVVRIFLPHCTTNESAGQPDIWIDLRFYESVGLESDVVRKGSGNYGLLKLRT